MNNSFNKIIFEQMGLTFVKYPMARTYNLPIIKCSLTFKKLFRKKLIVKRVKIVPCNYHKRYS